MANWASVYAEMTFKDDGCAKKFHNKVRKSFGNGDGNAFKYGKDSYLFLSDVDWAGRTVVMQAECRWGLNREDMVEFAKTVYNDMGCIGFQFEQEELGNLVYGRYELEADGTLVYSYVPEGDDVWDAINEVDAPMSDMLSSALESDSACDTEVAVVAS